MTSTHGSAATMDMTMELDDLKQAWQTIDRRLQQQNALKLAEFHERKVGRLKSSLRPLFWGQIVSMLFGVCMLLLGVDVWPAHRDVPHLLIAGLVMHAYGIATIIAGGIVCGMIRGIDHASPVLEIQQRLSRIRKAYIIGGMWVGLPWWVLWIPFAMTLAMATIGIDIYAIANTSGAVSNWINISLLVSVLGLPATWWFRRWSAHPSRARLHKAIEDAFAGTSLGRAQAELDALKRFTEE